MDILQVLSKLEPADLAAIASILSDRRADELAAQVRAASTVVAVEDEEVARETANGITYDASGTHLLLTLKGCQSPLIHDAQALKELAHRAAVATGATVLEMVAHRFQPQGTTVVVVLAESHASLHTYPESDTVFWDCFTCGTACQPELSEQVLVDALLPTKINKQVVTRE
jgi:S-adenosylmethionine decarboxylase proenzyme